MRIAVLGDIHGNWPALEAVLGDVDAQGVDAVIGVGDYLNTSAGSARVVEWMRGQAGAYFVRGDNDAWDHYERFRHLAKHDPIGQYHFVNRLPRRLVLELDAVTLLVQHAVPGTYLREHGFTEANFRYVMGRHYTESVLDLRGIDVVLFGDLHRQHLDVHDDLVLLYPGAAGASWPAGWALLEVAGPEVHVTHRRVEYDREAAISDMRDGFLEDPGRAVWLERQLYRDPVQDFPDWVRPFERVAWRKGTGVESPAGTKPGWPRP
jgi:protein phosphatase